MRNLFRKLIYNSPNPPLSMDIGIEVTSSCNSNCLMCSRQYLGKKRQKCEFFFEDFKKIIAQFKNVKSVQFCGYCESLLNKDIFKMIHHVGENKDIEVVLVTNGKLLTEENSRLLIEAGLDRIHISHHGLTKDEFLKMRGEENESVFAEVNSNIKSLVEIKKKMKSCLDISINYVVTKINYTNLADFILFAKELGVDAITPIQLTIIEGKTDNLFIKKELEYSLKKARKVAKSVGIRFSPFSATAYGVCRQMWDTIQIQSNGEILPCMGYFPDEASVGNIFEKSIDEIWNCAKFIEYRKSVINGSHTKCKSCQLGNPVNCLNIEWLANRYVRPLIYRGRQVLRGKNEP